MELTEQIVHLDICHVNTPGAGLLRLFDTQLHTDVSFKLGGQQAHAHRIVLASQSEYFECLLYGPMKEGRATEITLEETPVDAFRELLKYAYSGCISTMNFTTALDLHILADRFGFSCLKDAIESHLLSIISVDNVLHLYAHAQVSSSLQLQDKCEQCMDQNARLVIRSQDVQLLPKENFKALIARDTFVAEELEIFNAVQKWIEGNKMNRDEVVDLLKCVRLTEIPQSDLKSRVLPSGLYEQYQVLKAIGVRETAYDDDYIPTRGKTAENLNLFTERGTKLLTYANYLLDIRPEKEDLWLCVSDFLFNLTGSAADDPAYITVKFDDVYIVNQITFTGYSDPTYASDVGREHTPFCYQIRVSNDGRRWVTILDYSRLKCYSVQRLFFTKMAIRYLIILQTRGKEKFTIHLDSCSYIGPVPYKFRDLGLIAPFVPMTPSFTQYVRFSDVCRGARVFLTFTQPYSISAIRFRIQGLEGHGEVTVSVATQNRTKSYNLITRLRNIDLSSTPIDATFTERAVSIVSITITHIQLHNEVGPPRPEKPIPQFRVTDFVCQIVE